MRKPNGGNMLTVQTQISDERLKNLLCSALEGGSNYWYNILKYVIADNADQSTIEFKHIDLPFIEGCGVMISDIEAEEDEEGAFEPVLLNREAMQKGLQIMADKYNWHFQNFMTENDDAETGDVFLQCSLFGEIVFG
jgi:hypothetical protein